MNKPREPKRLVLLMDDDVFKEMHDALIIRGMTGALGGILDAAIFKIVKAIRDGDTQCVLKKKPKKEQT